MDAVRRGLARYFRTVQSRVHELAAPLTPEEFWAKPYSYGNSVENLILHLTGNLNYYIGAQIVQNGYKRHRENEFTASGGHKEDVLAGFDAAVDMAVMTIENQSNTDLALPYSAVGTEMPDRFSILLTCAGHASHHLGQIQYLVRELRKGRD